MDRNRVTELIILDVVGCTNEKESEDLKKLQRTEKNFPWNELAEYQNTVSLIPSVLSPETPSGEIKKSFIHKMDSLLAMKDKGLELDKLGPGVQLISFEPPHEISSKKVADWRGLSVLEPKPDENGSRNNSESELPSDKQGFVPASKRRLVFEDEHFETHSEHHEIQPEKIIIPARNFSFRKYILAASVVFVISAIALGYLFLNSANEVVQVKKESIPPVSSTTTVNENIITDSLIAVNVKENIQEAPKEELQTKKLTKDDLLPKQTIVPKPPEPTELNQIEPTVDIPVEDSQESVQVINAPSEQVLGIREEPAYFVAVEEMPEPIGGIAEIQKKIAYPEIAKRIRLEGKVYVRAYVDENGTVTKVEIVKGIGGGCDEAALDAISKTKFSPGKQRGKPIKVQVTIPVNFRL